MAYHGNSIHPSIKEFEFKYDPYVERMRDFQYKKRWYLFHGSPLGNWHSILRNGIRNMSNTSFMTNGAVRGIGVYMTSNLAMAIGYGSSAGGSACVAVLEILKNPKEYLKDSEVYVIPDDSILVPRYLYRIKYLSPAKNVAPLDGKPILEFLKKNKEATIQKAVPNRRIL
jgi:ubiquitin-conjugating enzyme E2 Q